MTTARLHPIACARRRPALQGRHRERIALDRLLEAIRAGESRTLVVRGEPGVGKTALLDYAVERASGCRVVRAVGVQSEMELPFAGLHQLCMPMLDRLADLPGPQRRTLETAFGLDAGDAPDRFLVGRAVLTLLAEVASEQPLLCVVDDAQRLDRASAHVLTFVARRLAAESVAVVFAVRASGDGRELPGLPELVVEGLHDRDARALLGSVITGPLDERVRDRIVAETRGNPSALLELPQRLTHAELAGGFGLPNARPPSGRMEQSFRRRLESMPAPTQRLLLLAAAEPLGDPALVWGAAGRLGIAPEAAAPAAAAGLAEFGARVSFPHPLVRSAIYRTATPEDLRSAHLALAEATDPDVDPDRRAWHRAHAAPGADEDVAAELERSAGRAHGRGGLAAAAAFLERAAGLTPAPGPRAARALAAARAKHQAGAPDTALQLLATAQAGPLDELDHARVDLLSAQISFDLKRGGDGAALLLKAARELEPLDAALARETYLEALCAAMKVAAGEDGVREVAQAALAAPGASQPPRATDLLLDGLALRFTEGYPAAVPMLRRALRAFRSGEVSKEEEIRWLARACSIAAELWDDETWSVLSARHLELVRDAGAVTVLPAALGHGTCVHLQAGELAAAASLVQELAVVEAAGALRAPFVVMWLAAYRGREAEASAVIGAGMKDLTPEAEGIGWGLVQCASALLYNGLARYEAALDAAQLGAESVGPLGQSHWALVELVEAAARTGMADRAADALQQLSRATRASGTDWALGLEARSRALLAGDDAAEDLYREAIARLGRTRARVDLARAHLLYGEWLRRGRRRLDARDELRTAYEMLTAMGVESFAHRAARELRATGETARKRTVESRGELTDQEAQIARLAGEGLSNPEIGSHLFISTRTVEYHLHKVFAKLDIRSRKELARAA